MIKKRRIVVDTNVLFEGLTKKGGAAGWIVDFWLQGMFTVHVSNAIAYEYAAVLSTKLNFPRWKKIQPVLGKLLAISKFTDIYFSWRPSSPDLADEHVIDCAMNAGAIVVTYNTSDFRLPNQKLGLNIMDPVEFLNELGKQNFWRPK